MNGVQTRFKCKLDVKRCKRFVFPPSSLLPRSNALKTKAIRYFQTDRTLTRIVSPPLQKPDNYGAGFIPTQAPPKEDEVYHVVDDMPEFPGGMDKLLQFINDNMQYPTKAQTEGIQGKVIVQFIIDEDGYIIEPNIVRSVESSLDNEALRLIKMLPQWKPGTLKGKAIKVKYTVPVAFKLK